jgi:2-keto-4-pentenoate hydratase
MSADQASLLATSRAFRAARLQARALPDFPGTIPATMDEAYRLQDLSIQGWQDRPAGWKIGLVPPPLRAELGAERLSGPIFSRAVWRDAGTPLPVPVFQGGFAAVEAEFVFRLSQDMPAEGEINDEALAALAGALHIGVEMAGSPLATINELGPRVVVSDFGNNAGLVLGPEIPGWRALAWADMPTRTLIDGAEVGTGSAASIPGGPLAALRFLVENLRRRGHALPAGTLVSTGATTGVHDIRAGSAARVEFGRFGHIDVVAVAAAGEGEAA